MNHTANEPLMDDLDAPVTQGAFPVWSKVFTRPGEQTFLEITAHRDATARSAYIWMFIAGTLSGLMNSIIRFLAAFAGLQEAASSSGGLPGSAGAYGLGGLFVALCSAPITGIFSVIGFAIGVSIVHATARFFEGQGTYDKLAYAFGAIAAPLSLISALLAPFSAIPFLVFCVVPILIGMSIYSLYLQVAAIKAVHKLGWGESAGALFLPSILLLLLCGVAFFLLMRVAGPSMNEIFQQIQQSL